MFAIVMSKTFLHKHSALNRMISFTYSHEMSDIAQIGFKAIRLLLCVLTRMFAPV